MLNFRGSVDLRVFWNILGHYFFPKWGGGGWMSYKFLGRFSDRNFKYDNVLEEILCSSRYKNT